MAEKKQKGRRAYLADFQRSASGEYIYTGATYAYSAVSGKTRKQTLIRLWLKGGAAFAAAVVQGFIPAGGMLNCVYVLLPFAAELLSACSVLWAIVRLTAGPEPIREYVYNASAAALPGRAVLTACFAAATLIGETVFLLLHAAERSAAGWLLCVLMAAVGVFALALRREILAARWEKQGSAAG